MVAYNSLARFGARTLAQQLTVSQGGTDRGKLQVTKLVAAPQLLQANLPEYAPDAPVGPDRNTAVPLAGNPSAGKILTKVAPLYPLEAKAKHISGSVVMHAIINRQGTIESLDVISAPAEVLVKSAMVAVRQWRYAPYLVNGQPVKVDTVVTINYMFGRPA